MTDDQSTLLSDVWSHWLLHVRHGGDPAHSREMRGRLEYYADRVLDGAQPGAGMTLADIGAGEGLIAFRAIERVGPLLRTILTDISTPMLQHAEALAISRGVRGQCVFHQCSADNLRAVRDGSVDIVATRAVLAYVADKRAALREFHRILKPGGRITLAEPILRDEALAVSALKTIIDNRPAGDLEPVLPLLHRWRAAQFPDTLEKIAKSPITNYTERDLVYLAQATGFADIHMEFHIDLLPFSVTSWEVVLDSSPHPWAKPLSALLAEQFTVEERRILEQALRQALDAPNSVAIERIAYLTATKPSQ
jgi:arsenite methyltransferase